MKLVIAQVKHETNTFSPVPTPLGRFSIDGSEPPVGEAAYRAYRGTGTPTGAFIALAERVGAEVAMPIAASAAPSGPVEDDAFEFMAECVCRAVADGCDAVLLDLHGAMVTRRYEDGEGELLRRVRAIAPRVPIGVALDMHANVSAELVGHATCISGYHTYPHIDMEETGLRVGEAILALLAGSAAPTMAWGARPMLPHVMRQASDDQPNAALQARCREMERQGALCASVFTGFPHADIRDAGLSAVVVTDGDPVLARTWCDELLDLAWRSRQAFVYAVEPLARSLARAKELVVTGGPIVLLDHYDNCASGGTMDTMTVLGGILDAGLEDVVAFAIHDPDAVRRMSAAGVGAQVTLRLGGKLDMPAIGRCGEPREVSGRVASLGDGRYRITGAMSAGELRSMGPTAVLDTGKVAIVVVSYHVEPHDLAAFACVGVDPAARRYVMLKSRVHWRAGLGSLAKAVIECAGTGVCTSDHASLDYRKVRRPIFPLDPM
jgi:microcystin degradation protein MlrC